MFFLRIYQKPIFLVILRRFSWRSPLTSPHLARFCGCCIPIPFWSISLGCILPMLSIKWLIILLFSGCILFFIPNLVKAVMNESLKEGFVKIGANPWALAAFSDFTVGFAFNLTFICVREASDLYPIAGRKPSSWSALFWVVLAMLVGNPAVLGYGIYQLVQAPSVQEAFIVRCATVNNNPGSDRMVATRTKWLFGLFQAAMLGLFIYYLFCCVVALSSQSIGDGWQYIKSDPWAYLTFCDNLLGVVFTSVYMAMVLGGGCWKAIGAWWLALWWLGNGTTAIFALMLCWGKHSLGEALLYRQVEVDHTTISQTTW